MSHYLGTRIPKDLYYELKKEAHKKGISLSQTVRNYLVEKLFAEKEKAKEEENLPENDFITQRRKSLKDIRPFILETLFLLREIAIDRNSQILRRAQIQLDNLLGEDRPKIGT